VKYKEGDVVEVRSDLKWGVDYYMENGEYALYATDMMTRLRGQYVTITSVIEEAYQGNTDDFSAGYRIAEVYEGTNLIWTDEMFSGLISEENPISAEELALLYDWA